MSGTPTDDEILSAVRKWGGSGAMTYVIHNILSRKYRMVSTAFIRRRLIAMEKAGLVERVPTSYAVQIRWAIKNLLEPPREEG